MLCNFCQLLGVEREIKKNEWKAHVEIHNCQLHHLIDGSPTESSTKSMEASRKRKRGSEKWRSLAFACGDIVKKNHSSSPVDCGKCGKQLRLFSANAILSNPFTFDHVCVHLDKPLFSCIHCHTDTRFTSRQLLQGHLRNVHKLRTIRSHFRDFSGDYEKEVIDMAKQCFQNTQTKETSKTTAKRLKSETVDSNKALLPLGKNKVIRDYSQLLLRSRGVDRTIECGECGQILCVRYGGTLQHSKLINHACKHLKQPMFACNNCENTYSCKVSMRAHQYNVHKIPGTQDHFIDSSIYYQDEIVKMMDRCFGKASAVQQGSVSKVKVRPFMQARTPLTNICRKLPLSRDGNGKVKCVKCGIELMAVGRKREVRSQTLINHACIHLDKPLFGCRLCEFRFTARGTLSAHLQTAHAVSRTKANITDLSTDHYPEIKEQLEQCFGHKAEIPEAASVGKPKEAKQRQKQSRLSNACRKLLAKNSIDNRIIKCLICKKSLQSVCVEQTRQRRYFLTNSIINHALIHLDKPMFTCRQCQHVVTTRSKIIKHLGRHGSKLSRDQYIDKSAEYQTDIVAMLEKCFGEGSAVD